MSKYSGKTLYRLSAAQSLIRWAEMFSIEPRKTRENNILGMYVLVERDADADALERAFNHLIAQNDSLRLRAVKTSHGIRQYIADVEYEHLNRLTVRDMAEFDDLTTRLSEFDEWGIGKYDCPLYCAKLVRIEENNGCALVMRFYHSLIDGYSVKLIFERIKAAYTEVAAGDEPSAPAKEYSILRHFETQKAYSESENHNDDRKFWCRAYNHQRKYSFPAGYRAHKGDCAALPIRIGGELYGKLSALAKECRCSTQSLMMTIAAVTTYVVSGKENFCIYSMTHGRRDAVLKKTIGCMMNTVPVFYDIGVLENEPMHDVIRKAYAEALKCLTHGRLPMGEQVPLSYKEPIKHLFNFNHGWMLFSTMEYGAMKNGDNIRTSMLPVVNLPHQMYVAMFENSDGIMLRVNYQTRKFTEKKMKELADVYIKVCEMIADDTDVTPAAIADRLGGKRRK